MKKALFCMIMVIITFGFSPWVCSAADDELVVSVPDRAAKVTFQVMEDKRLLISPLDKDDNPVKQLTKDDFIIRKGDKTARIVSAESLETNKEIGLNIVLVVDNSTSMKKRKAIAPLFSALEEFYKIVRPIDNVNVVVFDRKNTKKVFGESLHVRTYASSDTAELDRFFKESFDDHLTSSTYLYEAMVAGIDIIRKMPEKENKFMVVLSDGKDINSSFKSGTVSKLAGDIPNFESYSIDYMPQEEMDPFLKSFSENHGGKTWKARSAEEILPIFRSFSSKMLYRYVVSYMFSKPPEGSVTMEPGELSFRIPSNTSGSRLPNNLFFEPGSSKIPEKYVLYKSRADVKTFDLKSLTTAVGLHYNVLNIVGDLMTQKPTEKIRLLGCNSGMSAEKDNLDLSRERANAVVSYLRDIWGIDPGRMKIDARNLPGNPSSADIPGGSGENRRVEITFDSPEMESIAQNRMVVETKGVNEVKIIPAITSEYGVKEWKIDIFGDDKVIKSVQGTGALKPFYTVSLAEFGGKQPVECANLMARINVTDNNEDTFEASTTKFCPISVSKKEVIHEILGPPQGALTMTPAKITIEELTTIDSSPLLNYIYFDSGESSIPARYSLFIDKATADTFSEQDLKGSMEKYQHILNILGKRLEYNPDANITIVGCNANYKKDRGKKLSRARAESVKNYFSDVWGIDPARMTVKARNLPAAASASRVEEGRSENRRVEIHSDSKNILDNIESTYVVELSNTKKIEVTPEISSGYEIASWKIVVKGDEEVLWTIDGKEPPEPVYEFSIEEMGLGKIGSYSKITAGFEAVDIKGRTAANEAAASTDVNYIRTQERVAKKMEYKVMEKYALILFDFNSSKIKERNKIIVDRIIARVKTIPDASVKIVGHTDNIGKQEYNMELSEKRAKAVYYQLLSAGITPGENVTYTGVGPFGPLYTNDLPEGRAFNRTVTVFLEYEQN
ncbi:OmpA family protein [Desulfobacterales bacterium HSG16]|nr:OmpA family protein [Desulfobacterales bacterium HSG16]